MSSGEDAELAGPTLHDVVPTIDPRATHDDRLAPGGPLPPRPGQPELAMNDASPVELPKSSVQATPLDLASASETATSSATPAPPPPPPKLLVLRGLKIGAEYPIYEGRNTIGRFADKPVDIDLMAQESVEQVWCSRQHAVIVSTNDGVFIEDLNSLNGTWVNGARIQAGQPRHVKPGDIIQIGTVQMKLVKG